MRAKLRFVVLSFVGFVFPLAGQAGTQNDLVKANDCEYLNVQEFLDAQGTQSSFFPPVPDYNGWTGTSPTFENFALVDYAGLADKAVQDLGGHPKWQPWTLIEDESYVKRCSFSEDRDEIKVRLVSENAMGFAQSLQAIIDSIDPDTGPDFLGTPTIFGSKVQGTPGKGKWSNPGKWAFGSAELYATFTIPVLAPLPDLVNVIGVEPEEYSPVTLKFNSATQGQANEKTRCLIVEEVAATTENGGLVYTTEIVEIEPQPCANN